MTNVMLMRNVIEAAKRQVLSLGKKAGLAPA